MLSITFLGSGKVFDAIRLYRRAVQLEPNIEFKIYKASAQQPSVSRDEKSKSTASTRSKISPQPEASQSELDDLIESFSRDLSIGNQKICQPSFAAGTIRTGKHISALPVEVFILILKYVVSNDLDMLSLERFGRVCKGKNQKNLKIVINLIIFYLRLLPPLPRERNLAKILRESVEK